jgi:hypothetical protein
MKASEQQIPCQLVQEHPELDFGAMRNGADMKALACAIPMR